MTDSAPLPDPLITIPPAEPTTLARMRDRAAKRAWEIEGSQRARMLAGLISAPDREALLERDDYDGIVRLIDERIQEQRSRAVKRDKDEG